MDEIPSIRFMNTSRGRRKIYTSLASNWSELLECGLWDARSFENKLRALAEDAKKRFPDLPYNVEEDLRMYKEIASLVLPFVGDSVDYINTAWEQGPSFITNIISQITKPTS